MTLLLLVWLGQKCCHRPGLWCAPPPPLCLVVMLRLVGMGLNRGYVGAQVISSKHPANPFSSLRQPTEASHMKPVIHTKRARHPNSSFLLPLCIHV